MLTWMSFYDIRFHLIRNIDLFVIFLLLIPNLSNWLFGCLNLSFYLLLNMIVKGVIGAGDIKLSFLLALQLGSVTALVNSEAGVPNGGLYGEACLAIIVFVRPNVPKMM